MANPISILSFLEKQAYMDPSMLGGGMPMGGAPMGGGMPMGGGAPMGGGMPLDLGALLSGLGGQPMGGGMGGGMGMPPPPSPQDMAAISPGDVQQQQQKDPTQTMQQIADILRQLESLLSDLKTAVDDYLTQVKEEKKPEEQPPSEEEQETQTPSTYAEKQSEEPRAELAPPEQENQSPLERETPTKQGYYPMPLLQQDPWLLFQKQGAAVDLSQVPDPLMRLVIAAMFLPPDWE